jgi:hypothetical protein
LDYTYDYDRAHTIGGAALGASAGGIEAVRKRRRLETVCGIADTNPSASMYIIGVHGLDFLKLMMIPFVPILSIST